MKYSKILLKINYISEKYDCLFESLLKFKFFKVLMNLYVIHSQNEYNIENQRKTLNKDPCKYHCLDLHKRLNSLKHQIHYLTKKIQ